MRATGAYPPPQQMRGSDAYTHLACYSCSVCRQSQTVAVCPPSRDVTTIIKRLFPSMTRNYALLNARHGCLSAATANARLGRLYSFSVLFLQCLPSVTNRGCLSAEPRRYQHHQKAIPLMGAGEGF